MTSSPVTAASMATMSAEAFRVHLAKARTNLEFLGAFRDDATRLLPAPEYAPQHLIAAFAVIVDEARHRGLVPA